MVRWNPLRPIETAIKSLELGRGRRSGEPLASIVAMISVQNLLRHSWRVRSASLVPASSGLV